jgi:hypothetical protein
MRGANLLKIKVWNFVIAMSMNIKIQNIPSIKRLQKENIAQNCAHNSDPSAKVVHASSRFVNIGLLLKWATGKTSLFLVSLMPRLKRRYKQGLPQRGPRDLIR